MADMAILPPEYRKGFEAALEPALARAKAEAEAEQAAKDACIAVFAPGTPEYARLERAAEAIGSIPGIEAEVGETWFDFGLGWRWTTVLAKPAGTGPDRLVQALSPAAQAKILTADRAQAELTALSAGAALKISLVRKEDIG